MSVVLSSILSKLLVPLALAAPDEGMWLFEKAPIEAVRAQYGVELTPHWLEHVRMSCVRFSTGGSGSIISGQGLVMTNHHVGSEMLAKLSTADENLMEKGFHAHSTGAELACPDLELDCLWEIQDVTERVTAVATPSMSSAEARSAQSQEISAIEKESKDSTGLKSEVVTLYQGGRYHLYRYKSYTDVRLVFAPEKDIAFFGGDPDNFEFPRFDLDCCFFRIYEDGRPLRPKHWLAWSKEGIEAGEPVFVAGHPGRTERLYTVEHVKFLRDVRLPAQLATLWRREVQLQVFSDRNAEWQRIAEDDLFSVKNSRKALMGILAGAHDPAFTAAKEQAELELREWVSADPERQSKWGDAWGQISAAQATHAGLFKRMTALGGRGMGLGSDLATVAKDLVRAAEEKAKPSKERLREYGDAGLETLAFQLFSPAPIYPDLEIERLTSRLSLLCEWLGAEDPIVVAALAGKSPRARAEELVGGTTLADVAVRKSLWEGGRAAIDASTDPLIAFVRALDGESRRLRKEFEDQVDGPEKAGYAKLAAARFAKYGDSVYPDATFTLRLSVGAVKGYEENGQPVKAFTTFEGLYQKSAERENTYPFELPESWAAARGRLDLSTPYNFVSTNDIIGGNSGSPAIDGEGRVVGLIFDGNLQSLVGNLTYTEVQGRAVSVDSRAILAALRDVYRAENVVREIERVQSPVQ